MPRLVYLTTHPITMEHLMVGHLAAMRSRGFEVTAICAPGPGLDRVGAREDVATVAVPMQREIEPLADLRSLGRLVRTFRRIRPDIVNAGTTKAGLLGMVAAFLARVPVRIYTLRGLRLETLGGAKRTVMTLTERLAAACAHRVVCVSASLRDRYVESGLAPARKTVVLGAGSSNGVDAARFHPDRARSRRLRVELGIPDGAPVIGFIGRFTRDKGIPELVEAFQQVRVEVPDARLLLVGDHEEGDPVPTGTVRRIDEDDRVITPGFVSDPAPFYGVFDVLAFPSHREGFPNAPLEAAAAGCPCVGFDATGTRDAIVDGVTGALVPLGDVGGLAEALIAYLTDRARRDAHGRAAAARAVAEFDRGHVWALLADEYDSLLPTGAS